MNNGPTSAVTSARITAIAIPKSVVCTLAPAQMSRSSRALLCNATQTSRKKAYHAAAGR
jgi:hypothetical protein